MHPRRRIDLFAIAGLGAAALALAGCDAGGREAGGRDAASVQSAERPDLGLLTSLPIYWSESADLGEMLAPPDETPWPRAVLEKRFDLVPLDSLAGAAGLGSVDALLLAQPRALSAQENVALDDWVRAGGQVLVFADPLLTAHSRYHLGDRRRPQDVVLLSPILARWGLELTFDPAQEEGERMVDWAGLAVPVNLAGRFRLKGDAADCALEGDGLIAQCEIGQGRAILVADAALFDREYGGSSVVNERVLDEIIDRLKVSTGPGGD